MASSLSMNCHSSPQLSKSLSLFNFNDNGTITFYFLNPKSIVSVSLISVSLLGYPFKLSMD